jgi:hypothetical protein
LHNLAVVFQPKIAHSVVADYINAAHFTGPSQAGAGARVFRALRWIRVRPILIHGWKETHKLFASLMQKGTAGSLDERSGQTATRKWRQILSTINNDTVIWARQVTEIAGEYPL